MDIGSGVAIAGSAISGAAVIIKWLSTFNNHSVSATSQCAAHNLIIQQVNDVKDWLARVEGKLDRAIEREHEI